MVAMQSTSFSHLFKDGTVDTRCVQHPAALIVQCLRGCKQNWKKKKKT